MQPNISPHPGPEWRIFRSHAREWHMGKFRFIFKRLKGLGEKEWERFC